MTRWQAAQLAAYSTTALWAQTTLTGTPWATTLTALAATAVAWPTMFWAAEYCEQRRHTCHVCADVFAGEHPNCRTTTKEPTT